MRIKSFKIIALLISAVLLLHHSANGIKKEPEKKTKLQISIFTGELIGNKRGNGISENEISTGNLPILKQDYALEDQIKKIFKNDIIVLKLESQAEYQEPFEYIFDKTNWLAGDFLIKFSFEKRPISKPMVNGNISLFNTRKKVEYSRDFSLGIGKGILASIRNKETLLILTLQLTEIKETYNTIYNAGKFTAYSRDESWSDMRLNADEIIFKEAKAIIPTESCKLILVGEQIIFSKKSNLLTGINANIIDCNGMKSLKKKRIEVSLEQPLKFKTD
ncbi:MAG: hypothetical protein PVH61_29170 [Candidatus Aminicenantes bacterium]|jgi:hypothetical protein